MNIAIIPARGGSKRIPRKNIRLFHGKPMLAWSIAAARASGLFAHILVSTDDTEIAAVAQAAGAEVPFLRPPELADDMAATQPVIAHALRWCTANGVEVENACCIYPCAPFVRASDLVATLELMQAAGTAFAYPVVHYAHPVQRAMRRLPDGRMQFLQPENELARTQDLEASYHDSGQFYWGSAAAWQGTQTLHSHGAGLPIPHWRVVDIDTEEDWERAQRLFALMQDGDLAAC
jgi:pseudaminic acid cytidylyltransferase